MNVATIGVLATAQGGGGGDTPTPLVSADFKNGVYSIGGVSKTLGEVVEQNTDWGTFDASDITAGQGLRADALSAHNPSPVLTSAAGAGMLEGFVALLTYNLDAGGAGDYAAVEMDLATIPGYSTDWYFVAQTSNAHPYIRDGAQVIATDAANAGAHKAALRYDPAGLSICVDGGTPFTGSPPSAGDPPTAIGVTLYVQPTSGAPVAILEKIEFFSLTDYTAADLPGLSA